MITPRQRDRRARPIRTQLNELINFSVEIVATNGATFRGNVLSTSEYVVNLVLHNITFTIALPLVVIQSVTRIPWEL